MDNKQKRIILFIFGCIISRFGIAIIIKLFGNKYRRIISFLLLLPAIGFTYIYINGLRRTGAEVFGDRIWWNNIRPVHAILYFSAAILVYNNNKMAYLAIVLDTIIGLLAFINYHVTH